MSGGYGDKILGSTKYQTGSITCSQGYERTLFNWDYKVQPGRMAVAPKILGWAAKQKVSASVLVNPHVKKSAGKSKDWGWERWQELVANSRHLVFQCDYGLPILPGVRSIPTPTFEHAAALLYASRGAVTTEGGMHHAAGAMFKPAVVIFGGTNPPSVLGYDFHTNLAVDYPDALGRRGDHMSCRAAMAMITVPMVLDAMAKCFS